MLSEWLRRLRSLVRGGREDAEMHQELRFHLDMETEKNLAAGMDPREARRQAHLRLGAMTPIQESVRDARGVRPLSDMLRDVGLTVRSLRRSPLFTAVTVATLGLGIGATTAIYSFVDGILLSPLGFREPDRLMTVQIEIPELADQFPVLAGDPRSIDAWQRACEVTCRELAALQPFDVVVTGGGSPEPLRGARVSAGFFELLGVEPLLGRLFRAGEGEGAGGARVAVLTHGLWQRRYGGDPAVLGRIVALDDQPVEVVGVLPASFRFPRFADLLPLAAGLPGRPEFFEPLAWAESQLRSPGSFDYPTLLRLPPAATAAQATAELNGILDGLYAAAPIHPRVRVQPLVDQVVGTARRPLWFLLAAVVAVLLVACANVSNLFGARWLERRRDLALRGALGAPPGDGTRRALRESLLVALAGGAGGVLMAYGALRALVAAAPADLPRLEEVAVDGTVLATTFGVTLACGVLCALAPAWRARRVAPMDALTVREAAARRRGTTPGLLIGLQAGLGIGLLVVTGLLLASFVRVMQVDRGFAVDRILAVDLQLSRLRYEQDVRDGTRVYGEILRRLGSVPGIRAAGLVQRLPLEGHAFIDGLSRMDDTRPVAERPLANYRMVSPDYPRAMGIAVTRGRMFTEDDRTRRPIAISEQAARVLWPGEDPIGRLVQRGGEPLEVVGVVADARVVDLEAEAGLVAYVPYWMLPQRQVTLVVRTEIDPLALVAAVTEAVAAIDPALPIHNVRTMDRVLSDAVAGRRFQLALTVAFALTGLLLVGLGVYGVVASAVERRRTEIAVRLALGATARRVFAMALGHGMRPVALGAAAGLAAAIVAGQAMAALLYEVAPHDWTVLASATLVVLGVAVAACLAPAVRAIRTPTTMLLKSE